MVKACLTELSGVMGGYGRYWLQTTGGITGVLALVFTLVGCQSPSSTAGDNQDTYQKILRQHHLTAGVKFETPPFGFMDANGELQGYDIDIISEIGKRLSQQHHQPIQVTFQQVLPSTRIIGLNLGKLDLVAATMTITPQRQELIDFSDQYFVARQALMVPKTSAIQHVSDLAQKRILFVTGTTSEHNIRKALPKATLVGCKSTASAYEALKNGKGDALTNDDIILYALMKDSCQFRLLPDRLSKEPYGLGIRKHDSQQNTDGFRQSVNTILKAMKADGTLKRLNDKWVAPLKSTTHCSSY